MVIIRRISFLQSIQKAATNGYWYYETGVVSVYKLADFIEKFEHKYLVNQSPQQCWRNKKRGNANAKLFIYPNEEDANGVTFFWVMMLTPGHHIAYDTEQLKDLRKRSERLTFGSYELVQKPKHNGKESFTFRLTKHAYDYYINALRRAVRSKQVSKINHVKKQIEMLSGFAGVRVQRKQMITHYRAELKRNFNSQQIKELSPFNNFYSRQMKVEWVKNVAYFAQRMMDSNLTAKQQLKVYFDNRSRRTKTNKHKPVSLIARVKGLLKA